MSATTSLFEQSPAQYTVQTPARSAFKIIRHRQKNWVTGVAIMVTCAIVLLSPLPGASNHPLAWLIWSTILGLTACIVAGYSNRKLELSKLNQTLFILGYIFVGFVVFQAVPLPGLRGGISVTYPTGPVALNSLSIAPGATFLGAVRIAGYLIFYWLMLRVAQVPTRAKRIGFILFLSVAAQALYAITALKLLQDSTLVGEKTAFFGMATGTFVNRNSFATFLGMGLVLGLALLPARSQYRKSGAGIYLHLSGLGLILTALVLTQSRMGITASLAAALIVIWASPLTRRARYFGLSGGIFCIAGLTYLGVFSRFSDLSDSASTRFDLYRQVARMIYQRPITGSGLDSFSLAYEMYHTAPVTAGFVWDNAHSTYLTLWSEAGLIFGSIPVIGALIATVHLWKKSNIHRPGQSMALAGFACLILVGLHSLVDFSLEIQANAFFLLAVVALGFGSATIQKEVHHGS